MQQALRYIVLGAIFILPLLPFLVAESLFFPYITGKNFAFRVLVEVMLGAWIVLMLLDARYRPRFSWLLGCVAIFVAVIFAADLFSENVFKSFWSNFERMEGWVTLAHLLAYFVVAGSVLTTQRLWLAWFSTTLAVSAVLGVMGVFEVIDAMSGEGRNRIITTFGNATYVAIYSVFHVFFAALVLARHQLPAWGRTLVLATIPLNLFALFFTATRGAILGFLMGIGLSMLLVMLFEGLRAARVQRWFGLAYGILFAALGVLFVLLVIGASAPASVILGTVTLVGLVAGIHAIIVLSTRDVAWLPKTAAGITLALVVVIGGFFAAKDTDLVQRTPVLSRFASIDIESGTVNARFQIWHMAWQGFQERPLLGWGQESFNYVFNKYYAPEMYNQEPWFDRVHNIVGDWFIAGGALGGIAYFSIPLILLYYLWWHRSAGAPFSRTEQSLITGLLAAYFFNNLFVFDNITSYVLYFTLLAYVHQRVSAQQAPLTAQWVVPAQTVKTIIAPAVLVVTIGAAYGINAAGYFTARDLLQGLVGRNNPETNLSYFESALAYDFIGRQEVREQFLQAATALARNQNVDPQLKQEYFTKAKSAMEKEIARNPDDARLHLFMGTFLMRFQRMEAARESLERARALSPNKQTIYFQLGETYLNEGNFDQALEILRRAYELEPEYDEARKLYALSALYAGEQELAEELLVEAYGTIALDEDRFVQALHQAGRYEAVADIMRTRLAKQPDNAQLRVSLSAALFDAGRRQEAIAVLEELQERSPKYEEQAQEFIEQMRSGQRPQ